MMVEVQVFEGDGVEPARVVETPEEAAVRTTEEALVVIDSLKRSDLRTGEKILMIRHLLLMIIAEEDRSVIIFDLNRVMGEACRLWKESDPPLVALTKCSVMWNRYWQNCNPTESRW